MNMKWIAVALLATAALWLPLRSTAQQSGSPRRAEPNTQAQALAEEGVFDLYSKGRISMEQGLEALLTGRAGELVQSIHQSIAAGEIADDDEPQAVYYWSAWDVDGVWEGGWTYLPGKLPVVQLGNNPPPEGCPTPPAPPGNGASRIYWFEDGEWYYWDNELE
jgi:hypothetical protein